jgi:hypothetical protein
MSAALTFSGILSDAKLSLVSAGFTDQLWSPEFGWSFIESEASEDPFDPQLLAALQCFNHFFSALSNKVWVHLAAEMQAGKTGVLNALIRLVLKNQRLLKINPDHIFVLTGMGDNAWRKQTQIRLPRCIRENVHHNKTLNKARDAIYRLSAEEGGLSNILIVLDESHIASNINNRPNSIIFQAIHSLCPMEQWQGRNIRFLTISATDPSKVLAIKDQNKPLPSAVVRLQTTPDYQSIASLRLQGRIRAVETFGDVHTPKAINEIARAVLEEFEGAPLYHILRPRQNKQSDVIRQLQERFPDALIVPWDSTQKPKNSNGGDASSASSDLDDINSLLTQEPERTTFILLKNMFYAAKTLNDQHVGILYDRVGGKDDTNLQSLLGRACGYGKSKRTVIYCSSQTILNYEACWRELCSNPRCPAELSDVPASRLEKKMTGVVVSRAHGGAGTSLSVSARHATPLGAGIGSSASASDSSTKREKANEDDFSSEWQEFASFAQAKAFASRIKEPEMKEGFYHSSTTGHAKKLRYDEVLAMKGGKKTANLPWSKLAVGKSVPRLYVCYRNTEDPTSAVFVVRRLTRLR